MIKIKFPDGNVKEFESGVTGLDIARGISSKLAKEVLSILQQMLKLNYLPGMIRKENMLSGILRPT